MAETTTIKIRKSTKAALDRYREHPAESYDQVIRKMTKITEDFRLEPKLSRKTLQQIDEARARAANGEFSTLEEVAKRFGIALPPRAQPSSREVILRSAQRLARAHAAKAARRS